MFSGPIPGQSLTTTPKNAPYERPPEVNDPEEVILIHLMRLQEEDRMNAALDALEFTPMTLVEVTEGILRDAVANGIHSIDTGLIAAPVIHEFIKKTADTLKIDYNEGLNNPNKKKAHNARVAAMARKKIEQSGIEVPTQIDREEQPPTEVVKEEAPKGLMSKRGTK